LFSGLIEGAAFVGLLEILIQHGPAVVAQARDSGEQQDGPDNTARREHNSNGHG
jgi:hypothetical protein